MEIFKIVGFVFVALIFIVILKSLKREDMALYVTIISSIMLFSYLVCKLDNIVQLLNNLIKTSGINSSYLMILLKVTGISYVIEFAVNICKDAGSLSLASKVEMFGKVSIVILTIPILTSTLEVVLNLV